MFTFLKKAKEEQNMKIVAFSGNIEKRVQYLYNKYPQLKTLFDIEIFSFDYGRTKGDGGFVQIMVDTVHEIPSQILLLEDMEKVCNEAFDIGVNAINYNITNNERFKEDLKRYHLDAFFN
ncbi:hypothetical protein EIN_161970 [Entamoeba invadens IP1]|uniref:Uncharacterized protein n=1 Tax=Entamoeba invadens IP1 TaxID=370355 RepID=A0A0A1TYL3_ENTIV|nr:hypothetical protein EIN_161970 [Entamoeba invadens IP1]ELP86563.1 hypothetical protein EIN_161970 [Entamoeba invadens IP1]|eukprot:XP_004185909.1 hypothetical protein EIN_161970 [Entamoeba invadens IP1]